MKPNIFFAVSEAISDITLMATSYVPLPSFDKIAFKQGNGLKNMEKRTKELNGIFNVNSLENGGVTIKISIPKSSLV